MQRWFSAPDRPKGQNLSMPDLDALFARFGRENPYQPDPESALSEAEAPELRPAFLLAQVVEHLLRARRGF